MYTGRSFTIGTLAACLVFFLTPFASAQHGRNKKQPGAAAGVVLVNQDTIASGLGCADQTPGSFPIVLCASGSYQLSSNLSVPAGLSGISIEANDVTLNLNGFTIAAAGATTTATQGVAGVMIPHAQTGVIVENGTVVGFTGTQAAENSTFGVLPNGRGTLRDLTLTGNMIGVRLVGSWAVTGCTIFSNQTGIQIFGFGPAVTATSTLLGNLITANQGAGVILLGGIAAFGHNTISLNNGTDSLDGGVSMGDNVCGSSRC